MRLNRAVNDEVGTVCTVYTIWWDGRPGWVGDAGALVGGELFEGGEGLQIAANAVENRQGRFFSAKSLVYSQGPLIGDGVGAPATGERCREIVLGPICYALCSLG